MGDNSWALEPQLPLFSEAPDDKSPPEGEVGEAPAKPEAEVGAAAEAQVKP